MAVLQGNNELKKMIQQRNTKKKKFQIKNNPKIKFIENVLRGVLEIFIIANIQKVI